MKSGVTHVPLLHYWRHAENPRRGIRPEHSKRPPLSLAHKALEAGRCRDPLPTFKLLAFSPQFQIALFDPPGGQTPCKGKGFLVPEQQGAARKKLVPMSCLLPVGWLQSP